LVVSDNGVGLRQTRPDDGIGLANTRARLRQLYGIAHDFQLAERIDGGVVATILLPYRVLSEKDNAAGPTEARDDDSYVAGR
jgi:sensor histidine kinase YesM